MTDQLDELSKTTLGSYVKKAQASAIVTASNLGNKVSQSDEIDRFTNRHMKDKFKKQDELKKHLGVSSKEMEDDRVVIRKRVRGTERAVTKLTEQVLELIDAMDSGKSVDMLDIFEEIMATKLVTAIDTKREEIAGALFAIDEADKE